MGSRNTMYRVYDKLPPRRSDNRPAERRFSSIMYYNYHATAKRFIADGHLTGYEYLNEYHGIKPCLLLYFDNHRPMPIRDDRWDEYLSMIKDTPGPVKR